MPVSDPSTPAWLAADGPPPRMVLIRSYPSFRRSSRRWSSMVFKSSCRDGLLAFSMWGSESVSPSTSCAFGSRHEQDTGQDYLRISVFLAQKRNDRSFRSDQYVGSQ